MRITLLSALIVAFVVAWGQSSFAQKRQVADQGPIAIISFAGCDKMRRDIEFFEGLADKPSLAAAIKLVVEMLFQNQFAQAIDVCDPVRPWGLVLRINARQELTGYLFVPVRNLKKRLGDWESFFGEASEDAGGLIQFVLPDGRMLYLREKDGWAFLSLHQEQLASLPPDPTGLLGKLPERHTLAARVFFGKIPTTLRRKLVDQLQYLLAMHPSHGQAEDTEREEKLACGELAKQPRSGLEAVLGDIDEVLAGWNADPARRVAGVDLEITINPKPKAGGPSSAIAGATLPKDSLTVNCSGSQLLALADKLALKEGDGSGQNLIQALKALQQPDGAKDRFVVTLYPLPKGLRVRIEAQESALRLAVDEINKECAPPSMPRPESVESPVGKRFAKELSEIQGPEIEGLYYLNLSKAGDYARRSDKERRVRNELLLEVNDIPIAITRTGDQPAWCSGNPIKLWLGNGKNRLRVSGSHKDAITIEVQASAHELAEKIVKQENPHIAPTIVLLNMPPEEHSKTAEFKIKEKMELPHFDELDLSEAGKARSIQEIEALLAKMHTVHQTGDRQAREAIFEATWAPAFLHNVRCGSTDKVSAWVVFESDVTQEYEVSEDEPNADKCRYAFGKRGVLRYRAFREEDGSMAPGRVFVRRNGQWLIWK